MKTLMLAALAVVSLGFGSAMAQESSSMPTIDSWAAKAIAARQAPATANNQIQFGSSDVEILNVGHGVPPHPDFTTLANPG